MSFRPWFLILPFLVLGGCLSTRTPEIKPVSKLEIASSNLKSANDKQLDKLAGLFDAINIVDGVLTASLEKHAINLLADEGLRVTGLPAIETKKQFNEITKQLTSQKTEEQAAGEAALAKISSENSVLKEQIKTFQTDLTSQIANVKSETAAAIAKAKLETEAAERRLQSLIFFGGGAALLAAGALIFFLGSYVPFAGPKAAMGVGGAGVLLILAGVTLRFIENHPWILYTSLGLTIASIAIALGLMISNHHHSNESTTV